MLEILSNISAIAPLENEWNALAERFGSPMLRYEWFASCAEANPERCQPVVFVIRSREGIEAIAPMTRTRRNGVPTLEILGYHLYEPSGLLYSDAASLNELLDALRGYRLPVILNRLAADGPEQRALTGSATSERMPHTEWDTGPSAWVPLQGNWDTFEAGMSAGQRSYIKRKWRRAERSGKVEFEAVTPGFDDLDGYLQEVFRVEAAGWKGREGTAIALDPAMKRFCTIYGHAAARHGLLRLFFLRIGGETAAVRMAMEYGGRLWELKIGYDEKWRDCSPGILLTHATLRHICEHGLEGHEFLGVAAPWQRAWTDQLHHYRNLRIYPPSLTGSLVLTRDLGYLAARSAYRTGRKVYRRLAARTSAKQ